MIPPSQPQLRPVCEARNTNRSSRERQKPSCLKGADLYVARIGHMNEEQKPITGRLRRKMRMPSPDLDDSLEPGLCCSTDPATPPSSSSSDPTSEMRSLSRMTSETSLDSTEGRPTSLHDELRFPHGVDGSVTATDNGPVFKSWSRDNVRCSRPCYRCITYMHNMGIKRVFWTNKDGEWEGGKVRDLMDVLDGGGVAGSEEAMNMFVTKHEGEFCSSYEFRMYQIVC